MESNFEKKIPMNLKEANISNTHYLKEAIKTSHQDLLEGIFTKIQQKRENHNEPILEDKEPDPFDKQFRFKVPIQKRKRLSSAVLLNRSPGSVVPKRRQAFKQNDKIDEGTRFVKTGNFKKFKPLKSQKRFHNEGILSSMLGKYRNLEATEKAEKEFHQSQIQYEQNAEKQRVKRLIHDGRIDPEKYSSYTFCYDGKVIPVQDNCSKRKIIQVQAKEITGIQKFRIISSNNKPKYHKKVRQKSSNRTLTDNYLIENESYFFDNFKSLASPKKFFRKDRKSNSEGKKIIEPVKQGLKSKVSIQDSNLLNSQFLNEFVGPDLGIKRDKRDSLRKRRLSRNSIPRYEQRF